MPYQTTKRPYKTLLGHTRHAKSNEDTHGDGREKQQQDHMRLHKATQGHTTQAQQFNTIICHRR